MTWPNVTAAASHERTNRMNPTPSAFWNVAVSEMHGHLDTSATGLTDNEAQRRFAEFGANVLKAPKPSDVLTLLLAQFKSPIILIFFFATGLSFFLRDPVDAFIILIIVLVSGLLGFWQEHSASNAIAKLLAIVQVKSKVLRDGSEKEIP